MIKTLRKKQKEILQIKRILTEMKIVFDGFISRIDTVWERICEAWDSSRDMFQTKLPGEKEKKSTKQNIHELWDNFQSCKIYVIGILEGEKRERSEENEYRK